MVTTTWTHGVIIDDAAPNNHTCDEGSGYLDGETLHVSLKGGTGQSLTLINKRRLEQMTQGSEVLVVEPKKTHEVQFVSVNDGQLVKGRKLQFQHNCNGIAHNLQDLYLTSSTALYKYSMSGDLLRKLYEDKSGGSTVNKCAVSSSGDKIHVLVTNLSHSKVLTLDRDGTVLHTFTDPGLKYQAGIHMTALGQVLVCGRLSSTVLQLDGEGKKKLATLATRSDGVDGPWSVCYNRNTASIIVGQTGSSILVFKVK
ncbi:hypothetical protein DPMN_184453 [Dreissena polymorpha]|uniref:Uncharacterized protein n=1 Tax=Dreissena polymorpha TaxID=45954 RepID=A0A9D4DJ66_DREPO|nr:hypothetical protein DPMN_184453 [Dreissena polymorpha]